MSEKLKSAFENSVFALPLSSIALRHSIDPQAIKSPLFRQIKASIAEIGVIEPLVVYPHEKGFLLLDGHLRFEALKQSGRGETKVLFSNDDEGYTYNKRVNHIPPVAQHFMLIEALKRGVSEKRITSALNLDVSAIRSKIRLLA